jgi:hypothetical protein
VLEHPLDRVVVLRGCGGCARATGVATRKERGGGATMTGALYRRRGGEWGMGRGWRAIGSKIGAGGG